MPVCLIPYPAAYNTQQYTILYCVCVRGEGRRKTQTRAHSTISISDSLSEHWKQTITMTWWRVAWSCLSLVFACIIWISVSRLYSPRVQIRAVSNNVRIPENSVYPASCVNFHKLLSKFYNMLLSHTHTHTYTSCGSAKLQKIKKNIWTKYNGGWNMMVELVHRLCYGYEVMCIIFLLANMSTI